MVIVSPSKSIIQKRQWSPPQKRGGLHCLFFMIPPEWHWRADKRTPWFDGMMRYRTQLLCSHVLKWHLIAPPWEPFYTTLLPWEFFFLKKFLQITHHLLAQNRFTPSQHLHRWLGLSASKEYLWKGCWYPVRRWKRIGMRALRNIAGNADYSDMTPQVGCWLLVRKANKCMYSWATNPISFSSQIPNMQSVLTYLFPPHNLHTHTREN